MEIVFDKKYLSDLYYTGKTTDKKHRFQPDVVKRYKLRIETLESAKNIEDLFQINSLHYEVLKGDKQGISSIRVNNQYRIEFTTSSAESETIVTICNILELSNHYN
jgi:proteic killer suppression protein